MPFNFFKKKAQPVQERKNLGEYSQLSFVDYLRGNGHYNLAAYACMKYYSKVSAIKHSVGIQASGVAGLTIALKNKKTGETIRNHPVLELLNKPNKDQTLVEFINSLVSFLRAAGYVGVTAVGDPKRPPLELSIIPTQYLNASNGTSLPDSIDVNAPDYNDQYDLIEGKDLYRYYSRDEQRELYVIKEFNPQVSGASFFGMSELTPLLPEIEQFIHANNHNLSLLEKGARPSGIMVIDDYLPDDQYMRIKEQLTSYFSGSSNAGRIIVGEKMKDFKQLSQ